MTAQILTPGRARQGSAGPPSLFFARPESAIESAVQVSLQIEEISADIRTGRPKRRLHTLDPRKGSVMIARSAELFFFCAHRGEGHSGWSGEHFESTLSRRR